MTPIRVVATHAPDVSGHYRVRQPAKAVREHTDALEVVDNPAGGILIEFDDRKGLTLHFDQRPDLVVLQRPMMRFMPAVIDLLHAYDIPVIVEIDDDFHTAHPQNRAFTLNHPKLNPNMNWHHLGDCIRKADWLTVSTPALAKRYGGHGRCTVIRNSVDDWWLDIPNEPQGKRIGWPGTPVHHPTDMQATKGAVMDILREHPDWTFACIGGGTHYDEIVKGFGLTDLDRDRIEMTPWKPLELHPYLVSTLDVGIVPLAMNAFNQAKSCLKGLEFAALGIPFVATQTEEYDWLQEYGIGLCTPNRVKDWRTTLRMLVGPAAADYRAAAAEDLRMKIRGRFTINRNWDSWAILWSEVAMRGVRSHARPVRPHR